MAVLKMAQGNPLKGKARKKAYMKAYSKMYYLANKEKINANCKTRQESKKEAIAVYKKAYRSANKDSIAVKDRIYSVSKKYGISPKDYESMLASQGHRCGICGSQLQEGKSYVDHCHDTGYVRGILCCQCNWLLGYVKDDTQILKNAIRYLSGNK